VFLFVGIGPFGTPYGLVAQTLRRPQLLIYSKVGVVVNLGLGLPLSYQFGASGMAIAAALS
jgi:O-antigen/teichoic acid export membrane protein